MRNYLEYQLLAIVTLFASAMLLAGTALAAEDEYVFSWTRGEAICGDDGDGTTVCSPGLVDFSSVVRDNAGTMESARFTFNSTTNILSVEMVLSDPTIASGACPSSPPVKANLITFVFTSGELPDQAANNQNVVFFFDATTPVPSLSAYGYDGDWEMSNPINESYLNGEDICSSRRPDSCTGWVQSRSLVDLAGGLRRYAFSVDVTAINNFSPASPGPFPFEGVSFTSTVGFSIETHGYPNLEILYDSPSRPGFISDIIAESSQDCPENSTEPDGIWICNGDRFGNAAYSGFFGFSNAFTFRNPICEQEGLNFSLDVGVPFQTNFSGGSPDGLDVTINYSGVPAGASVDPLEGTVQSGSINGTFNWTPSASAAGQEFEVDVTYTDTLDNSVSCPFTLFVSEPLVDCLDIPGGDAVVDRCGVCEGDGTSCLGCEDLDISSTQGTLDSRSLEQFRVVRRLNSTLRRTTRGSATESRDRRFGSRLKRQAKSLFDQNWTVVWSIPSINTQCANADFCVQVASGVENIQEFVVNTEELVSISNRLARRITRRGGKARKLQRRAQALGAENLALAATVPTTQSVCTAENDD